MSKKWMIPLCACALSLCLALSGAWAEERGSAYPTGEYESEQTLSACVSLAGNALVVEKDGGVALLDAQGREIVPAGRYAAMRVPEHMAGLPLVAVGVEKEEGILWGVIDAQGKELVPPKYESVIGFSSKYQAGLWTMQAEDGASRRIDFYFEGIPLYTADESEFTGSARAFGDYLYMDHSVLAAPQREAGEYALDYSADPDYSMDREFVERMGMVLHYGSGEEAFSPFSPLTVQAVEKPLWHVEGRYFRDIQGNLIVCEAELQDPSQGAVAVSNGLAVIRNGNAYGLMDMQGRVVVPCLYDAILGGTSGRDALMAFGFQAVVRDGMLGYLNGDGEVVTAFDCPYTDAVQGPEVNSPFAFWQNETGAYTVYTARAGYLDGEFEDVIAPGSGEAALLAVRQAGRYGVIDLYGNPVIPCEYDEILISDDSSLVVCRDGEGPLFLFQAKYDEAQEQNSRSLTGEPDPAEAEAATADVTVHYVDETGAKIAEDAVLTLEAGTYRILPAKGAVNSEEYTLVGEDSYMVTVDKNGASLSDVTFTYEKVIHAADVTVHYVDEDGNTIAPDAVLTLEAGTYRILPAQGAVNGEEYTLVGEDSFIITIDKNGASLPEVTFTYEQVIHAADVTVHYVDETGAKIAEDAVLTLEAGTYRILPAQGAVNGEEYTLVGEDSFIITIDKNGASLPDVTFTYEQVIHAADVTVHYVDEDGNTIAPDAVLTLEAGTYRILPAKGAVNGEEYTLIGEASYEVTIDRTGASLPDVTFTYEQVIHAADVTVHYVDEDGNTIAPDAVLTLEAGTYRILPAKGAVNGEEYTLVGEDSFIITIDKNGATLPDVTFTYEQVIHAADVTVHYVDEDGNTIALDAVLTLEAGTYRILPAQGAVDGEEYTLVGEDSYMVTVDKNGASLSDVTFTYEKVIHPADVTVHYVDETGAKIAEDAVLTLEAGEHTVPPAVTSDDYALTGPDAYAVTVDQNGANPAEVTFTYQRVYRGARVTVSYVTEKGEKLAEDTALYLKNGSYMITPTADIHPEDYQLTSGRYATVRVTDGEASTDQVTFTYRKVVRTVQVMVRYLDEDGVSIAPDTALTLTAGRYMVTPTAPIDPNDYLLSGSRFFSVTVAETGATPAEVAFTYETVVHPTVVAVHYVDESGQALAPDAALTLEAGENVVAADQDAVNGEDYALLGDEAQTVTVDRHGASPAEITFTYRRIIHPADVTVHYVDASGASIAPDAVLTLEAGDHRISPDADKVNEADYAPLGGEAQTVTVDENGAHPAEITFTYLRIVHPVDLTVRYADEDGATIAPDAVLTLEEGLYRVLPGRGAVSEEDFRLNGATEYIVRIDENGASLLDAAFGEDDQAAGILLSPAEVTFHYETVVHPAQVTVRYVDEQGAPVYRDTVLTLEAGVHQVTPTEAAVRAIQGDDLYVLASEGSVPVTVDKFGASPAQVTFAYRLATAQVTVRYINSRTGEALAPDKELTLNAGVAYISPNAEIPPEYTLVGSPFYTVTVTAQGPSQSEVVFAYAPPTDVTVRCVDEAGNPIAEDQHSQLMPGTYSISPYSDLSEEDWTQVTESPVTLQVTTEDAEITVDFVYHRVVHPVLVTIHYLDENGLAISGDDTVLLEEGAHSVTPVAAISTEDYEMLGPDAYDVTVTAEGASRPDVTFIYQRLIRPATVAVHYVDEAGQPVAEDGSVTLEAGVSAVTAQPVNLKENYVLQEGEADSQLVNVTLDGAFPSEVTFVYRYEAPFDLNLITGENLLTDGQKEIKSANGFLQIRTAEAFQGLEGLPVAVSFEIECDQDRELLFYAYQDSGLSIAERGNIHIAAGEPQRVSFTATVKDYGPIEGRTAGAIGLYDTQSEKAQFVIRKVKAEIGWEATDWQEPETPAAPEGTDVNNDNLLGDSAKPRKSSNGFIQIMTRDALQGLEEGAKVTVSFDIEIDADRELRYYAYQDSGLSIAESGTIHAAAGGTQRVSFTATVKDYGQQEGRTTGGIGLYDGQEVKSQFTIQRIKIEEGETATPWAIAPNDPALTGDNLLYDSARTRESSNGFLQIPTRDALADAVGLPVAVSFLIESDQDRDLRYYAYQDSGISIEESGTLHVEAGKSQRVSFIATVKDYGPMEGRTAGAIGLYDGQSEKAAFSISQIKLEIGQQATAWALAPDDPLITGENLLIDSVRERESSDGFLELPVRDALAGQVGQPITVSFELKGVPGQTIQIYAYQNSGISIAPMEGGLSIPVVANGFNRYFFTTTVKDYGEIEGMSAGSIAFYDLAEDKQAFAIRRIKIEVGFAPTDWAFAPDDAVVKGQNLARDSEKERVAANGFLEFPLGDSLVGYAGMDISVSFYARADEARNILVFAYGDTGVSIANDSTSALAIPVGKEYVRFWFTTTVRNYGDSEEGGTIVFYDQGTPKINFSIRQVKIELGDSLTEWTPYPGE